ncbi:MAG: DnaB-like helicase C-terminal domain-containing protein [Cyanobacteriota bacterium]|jgi:replicative DNA helicase
MSDPTSNNQPITQGRSTNGVTTNPHPPQVPGRLAQALGRNSGAARSQANRLGSDHLSHGSAIPPRIPAADRKNHSHGAQNRSKFHPTDQESDRQALSAPPGRPPEPLQSVSAPSTSQPSPKALQQPHGALQEQALSDTGWIDAAIRRVDHFEGPLGPVPIPLRHDQIRVSQPDWLMHEKDLLAAVLKGPEDQSERWGLFRRRIGLRFNEPVPDTFWSSPELALIAEEIDAVFRGQRDIRTINAEALRHGLRERALAGRYQGSLQDIEVTMADLLAWGKAASALDFPIACDLFQSAKARQIFYPALKRLIEREQRDVAIEAELDSCRQVVNQAMAITAGRHRSGHTVLTPADAAREAFSLATAPAEERPKPISTGIPSLDLDMRGGVIPGAGDSLWVLAARSGIGKTTVAIAAAMGLAFNGAPVLFLSCELTRRAIGARLLAHYCRRAINVDTSLFTSNDLEGRGKVIAGADRELLETYSQAFATCTAPDGSAMAPVLYQSRFGATIEEICALVEDSKSAHPSLSVLVLDHFHAMGTSSGYGSNTTAELAARAMALKALAGRCELDILVVAQLNRGAYGSSTGPDVSHLAGTSELERYASAVWLLERPKPPDGAPPAKGALELHHGKFRHGQLSDADLSRSLLRVDRAHCFIETDEARMAFSGPNLYPGVSVR